METCLLMISIAKGIKKNQRNVKMVTQNTIQDELFSDSYFKPSCRFFYLPFPPTSISYSSAISSLCFLFFYLDIPSFSFLFFPFEFLLVLLSSSLIFFFLHFCLTMRLPPPLLTFVYQFLLFFFTTNLIPLTNFIDSCVLVVASVVVQSNVIGRFERISRTS